MTTKPSLKRADFVRQRQSGWPKPSSRNKRPESSSRQVGRPKSLYLPIEPSRRRQSQPTRGSRQARGTTRPNRYDLSFSVGRADVRAPALTLPRFDFTNPRWVSGLVTIALVAVLYLLWTSSFFIVSQAEVEGNLRVSDAEIGSILGILNEPVVKAVPSVIEANIHAAFPDLAEVHVSVHLPNQVSVAVVERTPVIAWLQDGALTWIDQDGMAFQPRGEYPGLIQISATGAPPEILEDPAMVPNGRRFITPDLVKVINNLAPYAPAGIPMSYDPLYGIGWQDPLGWMVHFGQNMKDIEMKLSVYHALVDKLTNQGIQPTLISMAYLDAPFYK